METQILLWFYQGNPRHPLILERLRQSEENLGWKGWERLCCLLGKNPCKEQLLGALG